MKKPQVKVDPRVEKVLCELRLDNFFDRGAVISVKACGCVGQVQRVL